MSNFKADTNRPFADSSTDFMLWLTRREWQFLYAWTFALQMLGERNWPTLGTAFRWGIAEVQDRYGYRFQGLRARRSGALWPLQDDPVCEDNYNWIVLLKKGYPPDYAAHLPVAIRWAEENLPDLDTAPMKEALHRAEQVRDQVAEEYREIPADLEQEIQDAFDERWAAMRPELN